ncbi:MAG: ABC transporter permease [Acidobacteriota bacterium]|jgi:microcin C transport system permease protein|nr:ABC transporter permease [Acidobacteriota bacterium]
MYNFRLSAIARRRIRRFRANRRGYVSLWIFLLLTVITFPAELITNDKPLVIRYKGEFFFPLFVDYPESVFGGFLAVTDYRDPFIREEIEANGRMIWPLFKYGCRTINRNPDTPVPSSPSRENPLGTDNQSRDVLARLIYGFRTTILFSSFLTLFSYIPGIITGAAQGYFGGAVDLVFQRFIEIWNGLPLLFILIILFGMFSPGFWLLLGILLLFNWTGLSGIARAEFLRARNFTYVKAARALGVSDFNIMRKHMLPNAMAAALSLLPFTFIGAVTMLIALDFIGFGLPPGSASLGELLAQGRANLHAPWLGIVGFLSVAITLVLIVFISEGVRDAFRKC